MVICEILGVYLVDFKSNEGGEMSGKQKILTQIIKKHCNFFKIIVKYNTVNTIENNKS